MQYYVKIAKEKVVDLAVATTQAGSPGKDFHSIFRDDYDEINASKVNSELKRLNGASPKSSDSSSEKVIGAPVAGVSNERDELGVVFVKDPRTTQGYSPEPFEYEIPLDVVKLMIDKKAKFDELLA